MHFFRRFIDLVGWIAALFIGFVIFVLAIGADDSDNIGPLASAGVIIYVLYSGWYVFSRFVALVSGKPITGPFMKVKSNTSAKKEPGQARRHAQNNTSHKRPSRSTQPPRKSNTGAEARHIYLDKASDPQPSHPPTRPSTTPDESDLKLKATLRAPGYKPQLLSEPTVAKPVTAIKKPSRSRPPKFIMPNQSVEIAGVPVAGPVYVGQAKSENRGVIDPSLPVKMYANHADPLGYWPDYCDLSPQQRGRYLAWLIEGRGHTDETGYAFLYFYGFERYVLLDADKDEPDTRRERLMAIIGECDRLANLLGNRSFSMYSTDFVDYIIIKYLPDLIESRLKQPSRGNCSLARFAISKFIEANPKQALPAELALQWGFINKKLRPKDFEARSFSDFREFFIDFYSNSAGLVVKKNVKKLQIVYGLAGTSYMSDYPRALQLDTPYSSPFELKRPNETLNILLAMCKSRFDGIQKAKKKGVISHLAALKIGGNLPTEAKHVKTRLDSLMASSPGDANASGVIVGQEDLGKLFGEDFSARLSLPKRRELASAVEMLGYCLVPDPEHKNPVPSVDDGYCLFKGKRVPSLSAGGKMVYVGIRLAYMVAAADGMDDVEGSIISKLPETLPNPDEQRFMEAFARWVQSSEATSKAGLKEQIEQLPQISRKGLFSVLEEVALADGELSKKEITQLSKMHESLGLGEFKLEDHGKLAEAPAPAKGKSKPKAKATEEAEQPTKLVLDAKKLAEIAASTQGAHQLLGEIFNEEDDYAGEPETTGGLQKGSTAGSAASETWHHGALNAVQEQIFDELIQQEEWPMPAVERLIKGHGQMVAGTIEAINDAAIDRYGEPVLEEAGESLIVYGDMVESAW